MELIKCEPEDLIVKLEPCFTETENSYDDTECYDVTVNNDNILIKTECESVSFSSSNNCSSFNHDIIKQDCKCAFCMREQLGTFLPTTNNSALVNHGLKEEFPLAASEYSQENTGNLMNSALDNQTCKSEPRTKTRRHCCPYCNRNFTRKHTFNIHLRQRHSKKNPDSLIETFDKKSFTCEVCEFKSPCSRSLKSHMLMHETSKIFKCDSCDYESSTKSTIQDHIRSKHSNDRPTYSCGFCSKTLFKKISLAEHLLCQHGDKFDKSLKTLLSLTIKPCKLCDFRTMLDSKLKKHTTKHHDTLDNVTVKAKVKNRDPIIYKCYNCDYQSVKKSNLRTHIQNMHSNYRRTYSCRFCEKTFFRKVSFVDHLLCHHNDKFDKSLNTLFSMTIKRCKLCDFRTIVEAKLNQHMSTHRDSLGKASTDAIEIFKCNDCDYEAFQKTNLRAHILCKHSNDRPTYSCRFCDKPFFRKPSLADHLLSRHGENFDKSLKKLLSLTIKRCKLCDFRGIVDSRVNQHMSTHRDSLGNAGTGTNIFQCNSCDYETFKKFNLRVHMQSKHSNERVTYSCRFCNVEAFRRKPSLACHLLRQHGDKFDKSLKTLLSLTIEHCKLCDFRTISKINLNHHMAKHRDSLVNADTDTIIFKCNNCNYEAFGKHFLLAHIQSMHSNDRPTYSCRVCNKRFIMKATLGDHLLRFHGDKLDKSLKTLFSRTIKHCKFCDFRVINNSIFNYHIQKQHSNDKKPTS